MPESYLERKKREESLMTLLLLFNALKFEKSSLFCCNGYRHVILKIFFYESQEEYLKKAFTKETKKIITKLEGGEETSPPNVK